MSDLPFQETYLVGEGLYLRTFSKDLEPEQMQWHWDEEDRDFIVLQSSGWKFQRDNQNPIEMKPGDVISVKEGEYHRGIKPDPCHEDLVIKLRKNS